MKVAYQGLPGAYSEAALRRSFGKRASALSCPLSEQVFTAVRRGRADFGILPVENTIAGLVAVNADLFLKEAVFVVGETYLEIDHCLLGGPASRLQGIKTVYSHPVALAQCRGFLTSLKAKAVPEYDTAGAARRIAERGLAEEAAIASHRCAEVYGLKILKRDISSFRRNITRFVTFTRKSRIPPGLKMEKTSVAFSTRHRPGALLACLQRFADHKINLTRLESRPIPENPFEYVFYADFIGGLKDEPVRRALRRIRKDASLLKVFGSYPIGKR